jgi:hypothetical protein
MPAKIPKFRKKFRFWSRHEGSLSLLLLLRKETNKPARRRCSFLPLRSPFCEVRDLVSLLFLRFRLEYKPRV